jgi:hypothetical protein
VRGKLASEKLRLVAPAISERNAAGFLTWQSEDTLPDEPSTLDFAIMLARRAALKHARPVEVRRGEKVLAKVDAAGGLTMVP